MKKTSIFLIALLGIGFTACDDKSDLGIEQVNPQEAIMSADGLTVAYGDALQGAALNINSFANAAVWNTDINTPAENKEAQLINVAEVTDLPENATVQFMMQLAEDEAYTDAQEISLTDGKALGSALGNAFQAIWGKTPVAQEAYIRFAAYVVDGKQVSRLGGLDRWYGAEKITITPVDIQLNIENSYKVQTIIGGADGEAITMSHSEKHAYDDPMFSAIITVTPEMNAQGVAWEIVSESGRVYYPTAEGTLDVTGEPAALGVGSYRVEANMLDKTYTIGLAYETLTIPGGANGWTVDAAEWRLTTSDYNSYYGYAWLDGEFKFATGSWDVNWGKGSADGTLARDGANLTVDEAGLYYITLDLGAQTYTITRIDTIGAIGAFNGWGGQSNLTVSDNGQSITGTVSFTGEGGWKLRANDNWDINLGGSMTDLTPGGADLAQPAPGDYEVSLHLSTLPYTVTLTAK